MVQELKEHSVLMISLKSVNYVPYEHDPYTCGVSQQTLYEYVFCIGEVNEGFCIETTMPRRGIPCSSVETLSQCGIDHSCLLSVALSDDVDILQGLPVSII